MKTYDNLYEKIINTENIEKAIKNAVRGKKRKHNKCFQEAKTNPEAYIDKCIEYIKTYKPFAHREKEIYDGISRKKRIIVVPSFYEQVMHHAIIQVMKPIFMKGMYDHSYASIPNRGTHKGKAIIEKWIKRYKNTKYIFKMDIKKFFDSIDHNILKAKFRRILRDDRLYNLICGIIDTTEKGLPLGFYTSQWFANWYLQELDHRIKHFMYSPHYIRYMDDIVIFGDNKRKLHKTHLQIEEFLKTLNLGIKDNWQVFRFDKRPLDFMGFKFFVTAPL